MRPPRVLLALATLGLALPLVIALVMASAASAASVSRLVVLHNATRADYSRRALHVSPALMRTAQARARRLARLGYLTHSGFAGALHHAGYGTGGENIAWASPAPIASRRLMRMWEHSPAHARNIYDRRWTRIGVGLARANGREYAVVIFAQ